MSVLTDDDHSSFVVDNKDPHTTATNGCTKDSSAPCLANGGIRTLIDGEEWTNLHVPALDVRLPGRFLIVVPAANLQVGYRPCGVDRIRAALSNEMVVNGRGLRLDLFVFGESILEPDTLAAPTRCPKYIEDAGPAGMIFMPSEHATTRVKTETALLGSMSAVNYKEIESSSDGTAVSSRAGLFADRPRLPRFTAFDQSSRTDSRHLSLCP